MQAPPQAACLDANNGCVLRIRRVFALENIVGNGETLDMVGAPAQGLVNHITQKLAQPRGVGKRIAGQDAIKLCRYVFRAECVLAAWMSIVSHGLLFSCSYYAATGNRQPATGNRRDIGAHYHNFLLEKKTIQKRIFNYS